MTGHALSVALPSAWRPASYVIRANTAVTFVLDYEQIAGLRSIPSTVVAPAPSQARSSANPIAPNAGQDADMRTPQEQMQQKARELERVRKELLEIRRHLNHQPPKPIAPAEDLTR